VTGRVIDHHSTHLGFAIGTCAVALAATAAVTGVRRVTRADLPNPYVTTASR
jgi:hypothetical protein